MIVARFSAEAAHGLGPAPDYHALGTFAETWAFLELFVGRCAQLVAGEDQDEAEASLQGRLDALDAAMRLAPELYELADETLALTAEIRSVASKRQAALQDLARASLSRLGVGLFALPAAALGPNAVGGGLCASKAVDELHMKACDLVRRTLLLLSALQERASQSV
jgi:hypothetical protein